MVFCQKLTCYLETHDIYFVLVNMVPNDVNMLDIDVLNQTKKFLEKEKLHITCRIRGQETPTTLHTPTISTAAILHSLAPSDTFEI